VAAGISFGAMKLVGNAHSEDCYKTARALLPASTLDTPGVGTASHR